MKVWVHRLATVLALGFLALTFVNASWIAATPRGNVKLVAVHGTAPLADRTQSGDGPCASSHIEQPSHDYLGNTLESVVQSGRNGAQMVSVDLASTSDGKFALFDDAKLECRTDGKGKVQDHTLAQLKTLDAGHGYTADGGKTFPYRGLAKGGIPSLEEAVRTAGTKPLLYHFSSNSPAEADMLAAALKAAGRDVEGTGDGFYGPASTIARIHELYPNAWAWSLDQADACTSDYMKMGWLGLTPESCRGGTLIVPIDRQWAFAGWPNRLIARMDAVGARVIVAAAKSDGKLPAGLDLPEQLGEIPNTFAGYVWVDDIVAIGPALRPAFNRRSPMQEEKLEQALERRRRTAS